MYSPVSFPLPTEALVKFRRGFITNGIWMRAARAALAAWACVCSVFAGRDARAADPPVVRKQSAPPQEPQLLNGPRLAQRGIPELPEPTAESQLKEKELIADVIGPELVMKLDQGKSKIIRTKRAVERTSIIDQNVIQVTQFGTNELEIIGLEPGETELTLWFEAIPGDAPAVLRYTVRVSPNSAMDERRRLEYGELENMINEFFPNSSVELIVVADKLIVRGQARDAEEAAQLLALVRSRTGANTGGTGLSLTQGTAAQPFPPDDKLPISNVISMLRVPGEQQVLLKVRVAELSRSALRALGIDFSVNETGVFFSSTFGNGGNILALLDGRDVTLLIRALSSNSYSKILAEPNLVTISGQTARFIAGGQFAVPTAVGVNGVQAATTFFQGFGTQLLFTPTVLDKDRIRLRVAPTFSSVNNANAVNGIPGLNTRSVYTTVDMREGQWLAIAGLVQDEQRASKARVPILGDIPVAGTLFSNRSVQRDETELLILVSPQLVHPLDADQPPPLLPGMDVTEPDPLNFMVMGNIEGRPDAQHRSTVWPNERNEIRRTLSTPRSDVRRVQRERYFITTPYGFSE